MKRPRKEKTYLKLLMCFARVFSFLPLNYIHFFLCNSLILYLFKNTKEGKKALRNITAVYKSKDRSRTGCFLKQHIKFLISTIFDLSCFCKNKKSLNFEGIEQLKHHMLVAESVGKGQIFVTAHLGNWELLGYWAQKSAQKKFWALAKPLKNKFFTEIIKSLRSFFGVFVLWTGKNNFQKELIYKLKAKEWLAFLVDQKPHLRRGPVVDFLGNKTEFVPGPAKLSLKYDVPIVVAFCTKNKLGNYKITSKLIKHPKQHFNSVDELTQSFASSIEQVIKEVPSQWCWIYKRWRYG